MQLSVTSSAMCNVHNDELALAARDLLPLWRGNDDPTPTNRVGWRPGGAGGGHGGGGGLVGVLGLA